MAGRCVLYLRHTTGRTVLVTTYRRGLMAEDSKDIAWKNFICSQTTIVKIFLTSFDSFNQNSLSPPPLPSKTGLPEMVLNKSNHLSIGARRDSPKMETLERNSSYILRLRIVDPIRMRRYESRSSPHSLTSVLATRSSSSSYNSSSISNSSNRSNREQISKRLESTRHQPVPEAVRDRLHRRHYRLWRARYRTPHPYTRIFLR